MNNLNTYKSFVILGNGQLDPGDLQALSDELKGDELTVNISKYICDPRSNLHARYEELVTIWSDLKPPTIFSGSNSGRMAADYAKEKCTREKWEFSHRLWEKGLAETTLTCYVCGKEGTCEGPQTPFPIYSVRLEKVLWVIMGTREKPDDFYKSDWPALWRLNEGKERSLCKECRDARSAALLAEKAKLLEIV